MDELVRQETSLLTDEQIRLLDLYVTVLDKYTSEEIREYSPIGWRKIPKVKRIASQEVYLERSRLEKILEIRRIYEYGQFRLEVSRPSKFEFPRRDIFRPEVIMNLFPLNSDNKMALDYLANIALPKVFTPEIFPGIIFSVRSNFVSAGW